MDAPSVRGRGQLADGVVDDPEQRRQLRLGAAEVVGRKQPERHDLDMRFLAPGEQVRDAVRSGLVPPADVLRAAGAGPTAVAVDDDPDMTRPRRVGEGTR